MDFPFVRRGFSGSFLLAFVEGKATLYRAAQFLPVICGYGALVLVYAARKLFLKKAPRAVITALLCVILWNQCADMNRWFYVDYLKYEDAKNTMNQVVYVLEKDFDTSKPVVFTGTYEIPKSIIADAYVEYNSETFYQMLRITPWWTSIFWKSFTGITVCGWPRPLPCL